MPKLIHNGKTLSIGGKHLTIPPKPKDESFKIELIMGQYDTITLPTRQQDDNNNLFSYDYVVDYGDGTGIFPITSYNDPNTTHQYTEPGTYTLTIKGLCESFYVYWDSYGTISQYISKVLQWGNVGLKEVNFANCSFITEVAGDTIGGLSKITSFEYVFSSCSSLTTISKDLFKFSTNATNFSQAFYYCTSLVNIPSNLFKYTTNVTDFSYAFYNCTSLTMIPFTLFDKCLSVTDYRESFYGCSSLTGDAPELWIGRTSSVGYSCFSNCTGLSNYNYIPSYWGGYGDTDTRFKILLTTTSDNQSVTLPHLELDSESNPYTYDYSVDWGDGSSSDVMSWNDVNCTHIYSEEGTYYLKINGTCETIYVDNNGTLKSTVTEIRSWGSTALKQVNFYGCTNLTSIPNDISSLNFVTDFVNSFRDCSSMNIEVPEFWNTYSQLDGTDCFSNDTQLINYSWIPVSWGGLGQPSPYHIMTKPDYGDPTLYVDKITDHCWITRGDNSVIYNSVYEVYNQYNYSSPANTEWNIDGWSDMTNITNRTYQSFYNVLSQAIGDNVVGKEMILHIVNDDLYYKVEFTSWTQGDSGGGFSYKRSTNPIDTGVTPEPLTEDFEFFQKANYGTEIDYVTDVVWLTRGTSMGVFNRYSESIYDRNNNTSPLDTEWNSDGWSDVSLSGVSSRSYDTLYNSVGGDLGYNLMNKRLIMHAISDDKYYQVIFIEWSTEDTGGGGFAYYKKQIGLDVSFKLEITTDTPQTITIPHLSGEYTYDYIVDYGDGTVLPVTSYNDINCTHEYTTPGVHTLSISGICETFDTDGGGDGSIKGVITQILNWGTIGLKRLSFNGCNNLDIINSTSVIGLKNITDFSQCFKNCVSLTTIPFSVINSVNVTNFSYMFENCASLTGIAPDLWLRLPEPTGTECFSGCTNLINYPYIPVEWGGLGQIEYITFTKSDYGSEVDQISDTCWITRADQYPIYNTVYDPVPTSRNYLIPSNTEWNVDGWSDMTNLTTRTYDTFYTTLGRIGNNVVGKELILHIITDDSYYKVQFTSWTQSSAGGGFSYRRSPNPIDTGVTPNPMVNPVYFQKTSTEIDYITDIVWITRGSSEGIFNSYSETSYDRTNNTSPADTEWNGDGWSDLSNIKTRAYDTWYNTLGGQGQLSNNIIGAKLIMHAITDDRYYQIIFFSWGVGGSGTLSYVRSEIMPDASFKLELTTTMPNQEIVIPHLSGEYTYDYIVDYGDGTILPVTSYNDINCTHIYETEGTYTLSISGVCETFDTDDGGDGSINDVITQVLNWGMTGLKRLSFNGCVNLTTVLSSNSLSFSGITDFSYGFLACSSLTTIPAGLFNGCPNVTTFSNVFYDCTSLTSIPSSLFDNCTGVTDFSNAFTGCISLTEQAPNLWTRTPEPTGTDCFSGCTLLSNYPYIPVLWGGLGQIEPTMKIEITMTNSGSITMPTRNGYLYDYTIDWGDGSPVSTVTTSYANHEYLSSGVYTIIISGLCESFSLGNAGEWSINDKITKILNWGNVGLKVMDFLYAVNLTTIPIDSQSGLTQLTNLTDLFSNCTSLTSIPSGLFDYATNVNDAASIFSNCSSLTSIPNGLFDNNPLIESFYSSFAGCSSLTTVPTDLFDNCVNVTTFQQTFNNCTSLTNAPRFTYITNVNTMTSIFNGCTSLTSLPTDMFGVCTGITDFSYVFNGCSSLVSLSGLTTSGFTNCSSLDSTFQNCTSLTSIPSDLIGGLLSLNHLSHTFAGCTSLTSIPSTLFDGCANINSFNWTFDGCSSITTIPIDLFDDTTLASQFYQTFRNCTSLVGSAPTLWETYPTAYGADCFLNDTGLDNYLFIPTTWGGAGYENIPFELEISTTTPNQTVTLPLDSNYSYNCIIDYGDGSPTYNILSYDDPDRIHVYSTPGTYTIQIIGLFEAIVVDSGNTLTTILKKILSWGKVRLERAVFAYCGGLTEIPTDTYSGLTNVTDWSSSFANTSITSIPDGIFDYCTSVTTFYATFNYSDITSIPSTLFSNCLNVTDFRYTFNNCLSLSGSAPALWNRSNPVPTGTNCFTNDTGLTNYPYIPIAWGGLGQLEPTLEIEITVVCGTTSVTVPHLQGYVYDYTIDYGDGSPMGTVTSYNDTDCTHTYQNGTYTMKISGTCETFVVNNSGSIRTLVRKVKNWGSVGLKEVNFYGCNNLNSIVTDSLSGLTQVTSFNNMFRDCSSLTTIPGKIFDSARSVTTASYIFDHCTSLTVIPNDLFRYNTGITDVSYGFGSCSSLTGFTNMFKYPKKITNFNYTFQYCTSLVDVPPSLFSGQTSATSFKGTFNYCTSLPVISNLTTFFAGCVNVTDFSFTFANCSSLTTIPNGLFNMATGVTTFERTFNSCTSLLSLPSTLFSGNPLVTNFRYTFVNCTSLTSIPSELFSTCTIVDNFEYAFAGCNKITSIPSGLFDNCTAVTNFNYTFRICSALTGNAPELWKRTNPTPTGTNCFYGDTGLTNYPYIPVAWGGLGQAPLVPMQFEILTTNPNETFRIPVYGGSYTHNFVVDWGDGSPTSNVTGSTDNRVVHVYTTASGYTITISGVCNTFYVDYSVTTKNAIKKVLSWGNVDVKLMNFAGCSNLTSVPDDTYSGLTKMTSFYNMFNSCTSLTSVGNGVFNSTGATNFGWSFGFCTSLTSVPSGIFNNCVSATDFSNCFYSCTSLTSVPSGLFDGCTNSTNFNYVFYNCSNLTSDITNVLINTNVNSMEFAFYNCSKITSLPSLTGKNVYNLGSAFMNCSKVTNIPNGYLDSCTSLGIARYTFAGCSSFSMIPPNLFKYVVSTSLQVTSLFAGCTGITSIPAGMFSGLTNTTDFSRIFNNCRISEIPIDLFRYNVNVNNFAGIFGSCTFTGITADVFKYNTKVTDFSYAFSQCANLTTAGIPSDLFRYNTNATNFSYTFSICYGLTTIPSGIFNYNTKVTNFDSTFWSCGNIVSVPNNLFQYNTGVTSFNGLFNGCQKLESTGITSDLFRYNWKVTSFANSFKDCIKLVSIPNDLFMYNTGVTDLSGVFSGCYGLTSLPNDLFRYNTSVTTFSNSFYNCSQLESIPDYLFRYNTGVTNFSSTMEKCFKLQVNPWTFYASGEEGTRFNGKTVNFTNCFYRTVFSGVQGTAPELWNCTGLTPTKTGCFGGTGNNTTSLTNYTTAQSNGWV